MRMTRIGTCGAIALIVCGCGSRAASTSGSVKDYVIPVGSAVTYRVCYIADIDHDNATGDHFQMEDTFKITVNASGNAELAFDKSKIRHLDMVTVSADTTLIGLVQQKMPLDHEESGNQIQLDHGIKASMILNYQPPSGSTCPRGDSVLQFQVCEIDEKGMPNCGSGDYGHVHGDPT